MLRGFVPMEPRKFKGSTGKQEWLLPAYQLKDNRGLTGHLSTVTPDGSLVHQVQKSQSFVNSSSSTA